jgi:hypothetical protein
MKNICFIWVHLRLSNFPIIHCAKNWSAIHYNSHEPTFSEEYGCGILYTTQLTTTHLGVRESPHGKMTAKMMIEIERFF